MFELDQFIVDCREALATDKSHKAVREVVARAVSDPAISPDGRSVVFAVSSWETSGKKDSGEKEWVSHLFAVSADGSEPPRQITFGEKGESAPAWSPDGVWMSFLAARDDGSKPGDKPKRQIWLMKAGGGEASRWTEVKEGVGTYQWSPDSAAQEPQTFLPCLLKPDKFKKVLLPH